MDIERDIVPTIYRNILVLPSYTGINYKADPRSL